MGYFFFDLFFLFIVVPVIIILFILWLINPKKIFIKTIFGILIGLFSLIVLSGIFNFLRSKKVLSKDDYYGNYVIDKEIISGKQADWQYDHFRFEIKDNDSVYFYETDKNKILQTYRGSISTVKPYNSERLVLHMTQPTHHILSTNPTIYRSAWGFTLVFESPKFGNMFFVKGNWKEE
ncbi:hypothetical protein [Flavobacterium rhizosphaerae]|uniref:Uncharacterized protein n=1 Tax=Flavobacterium rhizosphaerae TaxID=3163298 RepID=A0ABW8YUI9_9FLAO